MNFSVFGVAGFKNSGKTTMVTRLVRELTGRGYRISTVKHAHHGFDIDKPGRDSFLHRDAGASEVAIISGQRWALMHELRGAEQPLLDDVLAKLTPCHLVLVEGYKQEPHMKIELRRQANPRKRSLAEQDDTIVAIASDYAIDDTDLPVFDLDDIAGIADFILEYTGQTLQP